jgi:ferredoxin
LEEPEGVLRKANENGLVHLSLYMPDHEISALCNCCPCCCHDLQILRQYDRKDFVVRSEYVAVTDASECTNCGACVDRCAFEARVYGEERMEYTSNKPLANGLCIDGMPCGGAVYAKSEALAIQRISKLFYDIRNSSSILSRHTIETIC